MPAGPKAAEPCCHFGVEFAVVVGWWSQSPARGLLRAVKSVFPIRRGFPGGSVVKNSPANAGDVGLIPGLGRFPGGGNGTPLQDSCLGNPMDIGAWPATVRGVAESDMTQQLSASAWN